ncbi:MtrAB system histidine kinase MtrB, partial [Kineosporia sp. A_224]|uniref:MtrAB system histidine kinase MtrB n=1 Tax=Kineosporia sp. A_224 TaxID=1962180 RepID=UPI0011799B09
MSGPPAPEPGEHPGAADPDERADAGRGVDRVQEHVLRDRTVAALRRRTPSGVLAGLRLGRMRWRRSLRLRVVATTVVFATLVVLAVGSVLLARISEGLQDSSQEIARIEAKQLYAEAQTLVKNRSGDPGTFGTDLVTRLSNEDNRFVLLRQSLDATAAGPIQDRSSSGLPADVVPTGLRRSVVADRGQLLGTPVALPPRGAGLEAPRTSPGYAWGGLLDLGQGIGDYELYFVVRQDREAATLDLVRRTFFVGGAALVLLVAGVAFVVTRSVVEPVRLAARTAEEIASGHLDRRVRVRGEDELARLGAAFNDMATSLERQIHRLEELSRVQRRFVSDVSHELRTPLTTIRMATEVLHEARDGFDPATARSAELLMTQLDRFESLLADLLEVSRFDAGAAVLEVDPADVRDVVTRVVDGLRPLADGRCDVVLDVPGTPCVAEVDARRLERIVRNLVGNAIEHGEGRPVVVRVAGNADAVAVVVRDHGVGLTPAQARMVFNRFWRADPARARSTGGTGLGLAIALEDAHLHGGWLQVWGDPGHGASFRLTLPRQAGIVLRTSPLPLVPADAVQHDEIAAGGTHLAGTGLASGPAGVLDVEALIADLDTVLTEAEAEAAAPGSATGPVPALR